MTRSTKAKKPNPKSVRLWGWKDAVGGLHFRQTEARAKKECAYWWGTYLGEYIARPVEKPEKKRFVPTCDECRKQKLKYYGLDRRDNKIFVCPKCDMTHSYPPVRAKKKGKSNGKAK